MPFHYICPTPDLLKGLAVGLYLQPVKQRAALLNNGLIVEVCDARMLNKAAKAGYKKSKHRNLN